MRIRCLKPFRDLAERTMREVGDEWEAEPGRLAEINRTRYGALAEEVRQSYDGMTKAQLAESAALLGIAVPAKATKAEIIAAIEEA